ncbi:MAG TPA: hypothetical protein VKZ63_16765, partial [Kofleriaceae bacterium]|nr:hypothetical protein [Kofleriaceae bacterium]
MRITNKAVASVLLVAIAAVGCKKDKASDSEPAKADENRAAAAQVTAPSLFAHIPADTPYVLASFEALPASYWKMVGDSVRPMMEPLLAELAAAPDGEPAAMFARGLARELQGNLNEAGFKKLFGLSSSARWAVYGVGLVPVLRVELADPAALTGTVERLAKEAGLTLPTATLGDRSYWRFDDGDAVVVVAVADQQIVLSVGPAPLVDKALPFIVGTEKPTPNMADGGAIKETLARHGFSSYGAGYIDSAKLLNVLTVADFFKAAAGDGMPEACKPKLAELAGRFPRLAIGYDEVSEQATAMRLVLEMDKGLVGKLSELQVEVPGMVGGKLTEPALLGFGAGVDLVKAQALALELADGLAAFGAACNPSLVEDAAEMKAEVGKPLPPPLAKVRGGL